MTHEPSTAKEDLLRRHVEDRYGVRVMSLQRLDRGVFSCALDDSRRWIVRVFPTERLLEQVEGDAEILQLLEKQRFPAERCASTEPVSVLYGRGVLVTQHIEGTPPDSSDFTLNGFGELLGRLNSLSGNGRALTREAGALHHYAPGGGGPERELLAAASWLEALEDRVPKAGWKLYESLVRLVAEADTCHHLPQALIHPDPVRKNFLVDGSNELVIIDWAGAGRGPRIASLAVLLLTCALTQDGWSPERVDRVAAGYRSHVHLEESELERLPAVMGIRPLVFACWRYRHALMAGKSPDGTEWWWPSGELTRAIGARACAALRS